MSNTASRTHSFDSGSSSAFTNRIAQRLIGNFGFSNAQHSFDGIDASTGGGQWNLTAMAGSSCSRHRGLFVLDAVNY